MFCKYYCDNHYLLLLSNVPIVRNDENRDQIYFISSNIHDYCRSNDNHDEFVLDDKCQLNDLRTKCF